MQLRGGHDAIDGKPRARARGASSWSATRRWPAVALVMGALVGAGCRRDPPVAAPPPPEPMTAVAERRIEIGGCRWIERGARCVVEEESLVVWVPPPLARGRIDMRIGDRRIAVKPVGVQDGIRLRV